MNKLLAGGLHPQAYGFRVQALAPGAWICHLAIEVLIVPKSSYLKRRFGCSTSGRTYRQDAPSLNRPQEDRDERG